MAATNAGSRGARSELQGGIRIREYYLCNTM